MLRISSRAHVHITFQDKPVSKLWPAGLCTTIENLNPLIPLRTTHVSYRIPRGLKPFSTRSSGLWKGCDKAGLLRSQVPDSSLPQTWVLFCVFFFLHFSPFPLSLSMPPPPPTSPTPQSETSPLCLEDEQSAWRRRSAGGCRQRIPDLWQPGRAEVGHTSCWLVMSTQRSLQRSRLSALCKPTFPPHLQVHQALAEIFTHPFLKGGCVLPESEGMYVSVVQKA